MKKNVLLGIDDLMAHSTSTTALCLAAAAAAAAAALTPAFYGGYNLFLSSLH